MTITYTVAIDLNHDGDYADNGEMITSDVLAIKWRLGMAQPFDSMTAPSTATITLINHTQKYNGALAGHRLRIQSNDGTTTRTHFTGFIKQIDVLPGDSGRRLAIIEAQGPEYWLHTSRVRLPPMLNVTADAVIDAVLDAAAIRRAVLSGYAIVGVPGYNLIGTDKVAGQNIARYLEVGKSVFAYVGDQWGGGIPADRAIQQLTASERGRFFINRQGEAVFYNRHHTLTDITPVATFDDDMLGMQYVYGGAVMNQVQITLIPRSIGAADSILWSLETPQRIQPHAVRRFVARYHDANDNPIGALDVKPLQANTHYTVNLLEDGHGLNISTFINAVIIESGASAAVIEVRNPFAVDVFLQSMVIRGTPLIGDDPLTLTYSNQESITFYGLNPLHLELPMLTSIDEASQIAQYELGKWQTPRGIVRELFTDTHHHPTDVLARTLFERITINETQTNHHADYVIIAETHEVDRGGTRHQVRWLLEPADSNQVAVVGDAQPDGTRVIAY